MTAQHAQAEQKHSLTEQAARLYPRNLYLQTQWLRAVQMVRATQRGWVLDQRRTQ